MGFGEFLLGALAGVLMCYLILIVEKRRSNTAVAANSASHNSDYAAALSTVAMLAREHMDDESYRKYLSLTEALRASIAKRNCA